MPVYTNPWSTTIPPGSLAANQIDTAIQQARLDIAQRINTILGSAGSMSSDPVLNGTTCKDLTVLTAELATKTTLSGLTNGALIKATGAASIGNSAITEAQLVAALAIINGASLFDSSTTTNATKFDFVPGAAGTYITTFWGTGSGLTIAELKAAGFTFEQYLVSGVNDFTLTVMYIINNSSQNVELKCNNGTAGTYYHRTRRIA